MLDTHRSDLLIVEALRKHGPLTAFGIYKTLSDDSKTRSVSLASVKRHMPGLQALGCVYGEQRQTAGRSITVWKTKR